MATFIIGLVILFGGAALYGRFCEKVFGPDDRQTPAYAKQDGVDFIPMQGWKNSLNYLTNPRDVQRTFQRLHLFISPGGLLTFDVRLPERLAALDGQVFLDETEDTYCVWRTEYRRGLCTYYMDLFTLAEDGSWDRSFELHRQRGYSVEQLTQWLEEAGFTEIRTWGDGKLRRPMPGEDRVYFTCIRK